MQRDRVWSSFPPLSSYLQVVESIVNINMLLIYVDFRVQFVIHASMDNPIRIHDNRWTITMDVNLEKYNLYHSNMYCKSKGTPEVIIYIKINAKIKNPIANWDKKNMTKNSLNFTYLQRT